MAEGAEFAHQGKFEEARLRYTEACQLVHSFNCIISLASTEYKTDHYVEAYDHLREAEADPKAATAPPSTREQLRIMLEDTQKGTAHLAITAKAATAVYLDGALVGMAPLSATVTTLPGKHVVDGKTSEGTTSVTVDAVANDSTNVDLTRPVPPAPSPAPPPSPAASAPPTPTTQSAIADTSTPPPSNSWWTPTRVAGVGVGAVALVGIGVGIGFRVAVSGNDGDINSLRSTIPPSSCSGGAITAACSNLNDKISAAHQNATAGNVSFAIGAAAAVTSAALIIFGRPHREPPATAEWHPVFGVGALGVAGHF
jgi:hypothetical protein